MANEKLLTPTLNTIGTSATPVITVLQQQWQALSRVFSYQTHKCDLGVPWWKYNRAEELTTMIPVIYHDRIEE
jgi:hypothetical protein